MDYELYYTRFTISILKMLQLVLYNGYDFEKEINKKKLGSKIKGGRTVFLFCLVSIFWFYKNLNHIETVRNLVWLRFGFFWFTVFVGFILNKTNKNHM